MRYFKPIIEQLYSIISYLLRWTLLTIPVALTVGSLVALFLWLLDLAIHIRFEHEWLLFLLPLAGVLIYFSYKYLGQRSEAGNNLIMDEIHEPGGGVPTRMAPLVLLTSVITLVSRTNGAIRTGTPPPGSWISSMMRLLPASEFLPRYLYKR